MRIGLIIIIFQLTFTFNSNCQDYYDFCSDTLNVESLIGKHVKIFSLLNPVTPIDYKTYRICDTTLISRIKQTHEKYFLNSGFLYSIKDQEFEIVYVSNVAFHIYNDWSGSLDKRFYVLRLKNDYFPVECQDIVFPHELDYQQIRKIWDNKYKFYPKECFFSQVKGMFTHEWIERTSSNFACDLSEHGIDTIIFAKIYYAGFAEHIPKAAVLWIDNGLGYMKGFIDKGNRNPIRETDTILFDWNLILNYYKKNSIEIKQNELNKGWHGYEVHLICQFGSEYYKGTISSNYFELTYQEMNENQRIKFFKYFESIFQKIDNLK